ncbi:hypothetical protein LTR56_027609 [Elasticomyces elasticus]|nr:hypothetical protein LTR56_027609 [Elasticomyces elasticus]KAK4904347.1 hypothetical protein LTR49_026177 [Elasticomyces elasticus]KAK5732426.1 hypothetical protein LTS12_027123 [Elasticomyces elasticus]
MLAATLMLPALLGTIPQVFAHPQLGFASLPSIGGSNFVTGAGAFTCEAKDQLACAASDLTPNNWVANGIDDIVFCRMVPSMNGAAINAPNQPHAYISFEANGLTSDEFNCSDFNRPERCVFNTQTAHAAATLCKLFQKAGSFPQDGFIAQSFINLYWSLRNMFFAVQTARDQLITEGFVDDMVKNLGRVKPPIPRSVLFKLVNLWYPDDSEPFCAIWVLLVE